MFLKDFLVQTNIKEPTFNDPTTETYHLRLSEDQEVYDLFVDKDSFRSAMLSKYKFKNHMNNIFNVHKLIDERSAAKLLEMHKLKLQELYVKKISKKLPINNSVKKANANRKSKILFIFVYVTLNYKF